MLISRSLSPENNAPPPSPCPTARTARGFSNKVFDAMERVHQCATIQLDFQLPIRFNLK